MLKKCRKKISNRVAFLIIEPKSYEFKPKERLLREKVGEYGFDSIHFVYFHDSAIDDPENLTADFENMKEKIFEMVEKEYGLIFTVGGIGLDRDDFVPEATLAITDRRLYGMETALFNFMEKVSEDFAFRRPIIAIRKKSIIMNLPEEFEYIEKILDFFLPRLKKFLQISTN